MSKLTEDMWNEVLSYHETKEDEIMENGVTLAEYAEFANAIITKNNPIINTGLKSLSIKSQNLARILANDGKMSESLYNSKTDAMFIDACVVEGEFFSENNLYNLARKSLETDSDIEYCEDLHSQVLNIKKECIDKIDAAIKDVKGALEDSQSYIGMLHDDMRK